MERENHDDRKTYRMYLLIKDGSKIGKKGQTIKSSPQGYYYKMFKIIWEEGRVVGCFQNNNFPKCRVPKNPEVPLRSLPWERNGCALCSPNVNFIPPVIIL